MPVAIGGSEHGPAPGGQDQVWLPGQVMQHGFLRVAKGRLALVLKEFRLSSGRGGVRDIVGVGEGSAQALGEESATVDLPVPRYPTRARPLPARLVARSNNALAHSSRMGLNFRLTT